MALKLLGSLESSGGNVGIGTSSPDSKLHIEGSTDGTGTGADAILHVKQTGGWNGNEPWALYVEGYSYLNGFRINAADGIRALHKVASGGQLGFSVTDTAPITFTQSNSTERMRVHTNGNVGIGTASPNYKLDVAGNVNISSTGGYLRWNSGDIAIKNEGSYKIGFQTYNTTSSTLTTKMVLDTNGNVGMGTTSPNAPLHIGPLTGGNGTAQERLRLTGDYTATGSGVLLRFTNQHNSGANPNTGEYNLAGIVAYDYQSDWGGALAFQTAPSTSTGGNLTTRMTIDQFGKVGIGDTSPDTNLHVHSAGGSGVVTQIKVSQADDGAGHAGADAILQSSGWGEAFLKLGGHKAYAGGGDFNIESATDLALKSGGSTTRMFINSSGNIGMGTTGPIAKLDVQSTGLAANPTIQIVNTSSGTFNHSINALAPNLTTGENNIFIIGRAASVKNSGYIGYKYSAAGSNLNVLTFGHWNSDNLMNLTGDGKLGIGTQNPGYKLDVTDSARIDGVRIGRDFSINNRATVRIDSNGDAPSDILFGHTAAANQSSWTGVHWAISARDSGSGAASGDKFTIWRGGGHASPYNSESQFLTITPDLKMGIGTTAPSTKLHVNGVITATSGTSTNWNTAYGWGNHGSVGYLTTATAATTYAPLASPALTGTPTAPTAGATVNTTQLATTAFVQTAIANLSDSAPATLNTLNELAAALGDDANFSTTVTASIAAKLPLAGGNLTGNLGINSSNPQAPLDVQPNSSYKVTKVGDDRTSHYKFTGAADHTLTLASGSYHSSEVVITAHQTNGGTNNNLYIRGIWTNNHTSHHWHEIENIGGLSGSSFTITNGQSGDTTNSGELEIVHDYVSGSFGQMVVRVTDHYGTHSYTIS